MSNRDHTFYTDEFLEASLSKVKNIDLTAEPFVGIKDEELEETPMPAVADEPFVIDFGLDSSSNRFDYGGLVDMQ